MPVLCMQFSITKGKIEDFAGNNDESSFNIFTLKCIQPETVPIRDVNNKTLFG